MSLISEEMPSDVCRRNTDFFQNGEISLLSSSARMEVTAYLRSVSSTVSGNERTLPQSITAELFLTRHTGLVSFSPRCPFLRCFSLMKLSIDLWGFLIISL